MSYNDNPRTINKKGLSSCLSSACAILNHPHPQNGTNPLSNPPGASSPRPPSRAHQCLWSLAQVQMNSRPHLDVVPS